MKSKLLTSRLARVRKLSRALLRHSRGSGFDSHFVTIRDRLESALGSLTELARQPGVDHETLDAVLCARIGHLGIRDQIEAMAAHTAG